MCPVRRVELAGQFSPVLPFLVQFRAEPVTLVAQCLPLCLMVGTLLLKLFTPPFPLDYMVRTLTC